MTLINILNEITFERDAKVPERPKKAQNLQVDISCRDFTTSYTATPYLIKTEGW